jgi:hypothetical protein
MRAKCLGPKTLEVYQDEGPNATRLHHLEEGGHQTAQQELSFHVSGMKRQPLKCNLFRMYVVYVLLCSYVLSM